MIISPAGGQRIFEFFAHHLYSFWCALFIYSIWIFFLCLEKFPYAGQNIARRYNNIEYEDKDIAIEVRYNRDLM